MIRPISSNISTPTTWALVSMPRSRRSEEDQNISFQRSRLVQVRSLPRWRMRRKLCDLEDRWSRLISRRNRYRLRCRASIKWRRFVLEHLVSGHISIVGFPIWFQTYCSTALSEEESSGWDLEVVSKFHILREIQSLTNDIRRENLEDHVSKT